jgi:hypothetical protein
MKMRSQPMTGPRYLLLVPVAAALLLAPPLTAPVQGVEPAGGTGAFVATGSMTAARSGHTATPLPDGLVLVIGGTGEVEGEQTLLATAEVWDPSGGSFAPAGSLARAREGYTATPLPDGRVLVVGGAGPESAGETAELWDAATQAFVPTGPPAVARTWHTAILLPDGRVLVVGGDRGDTTTSAEAWDPVTGTFHPAGSLAEARWGETATLLPDGRVLVVGGSSPDGARSLAELWDPASATFVPAGSLAEGRWSHTATLLPDGRVLVIGGITGTREVSGQETSVPAVTAELWDPATSSFTPAGALAAARWGHTATLLHDGRVLVVGGGGDGYAAGAELWDPAIGAFLPAGSLVDPRGSHTATLLPDGRVLVAGGNEVYRSLRSAALYDPETGVLAPTSPMTTERTWHTATLLADGRVLVAGGQGRDGILATAEVWDPALTDPVWPTPVPGAVPAWERLPVPDDDVIRDLIPTPDGYLAVGRAGGAWTSNDCRTWTAQTGPVPVDAGSRVSIEAVVTGGPGYVAVGMIQADPNATTTESTGLIWSSPDGSTWTEAFQVPGRWGGVADIVAFDGRLVAVGSQEGELVTWTSTDGIDWETTHLGDYADAWGGYQRIVEGGPGLVVTGGDAFAWTSADGTTWQGVEAGGPGSSGGTKLAVGPGGRLLRTGVTELWISDDGVAWEPIVPSPFVAHRDALGDLIEQVVGTDDGFIAVGFDEEGGAVWRSPDGRTWTRDPVEPMFDWGTLERVFRCEDGLLVSGHPGDGSAGSWFAPDGAAPDGAAPAGG